jgi:hypothetical protein
VLTPEEASSSGRLRTCRVIWTRVRGIRRVRIMLRSVLWRRVSRWRSRGPGGGLVWLIASCLSDPRALHTSHSCCGSHVDFYRGVLGHLVSPQHFDGPVDCADDGVAIVCIRRGAVGAVEMCECDFWGDHCAGVCVLRWTRAIGSLVDLKISKVSVGKIEQGKAPIRLRLKLPCRGASSWILDRRLFTSLCDSRG